MHYAEVDPHDRHKGHKGDPHATPDRNRLVAEICEDDLKLTAIVRVECAGRIEHHDPVPQGEPRARPDLAFYSWWEHECEAGRDGGATARGDDDGRTRG